MFLDMKQGVVFFLWEHPSSKEKKSLFASLKTNIIVLSRIFQDLSRCKFQNIMVWWRFVIGALTIFQTRKLWKSIKNIVKIMMRWKLFFRKKVQFSSLKTTSILWECQLWFEPTLSHSQNRLTHVSRILTEASRKLTKRMNLLDFVFTWSVLTNLQNQSCLQKQERRWWPQQGRKLWWSLWQELWKAGGRTIWEKKYVRIYWKMVCGRVIEQFEVSN